MKKVIFFIVVFVMYWLLWGPMGWGALTVKTLSIEPRATADVSIEASRMAKGLISTVILTIGILGPLFISGIFLFVFGVTSGTIQKVEDTIQ